MHGSRISRNPPMRPLLPAVLLAAMLACFAEAHPGAHVVIDHFTAEIEKRPWTRGCASSAASPIPTTDSSTKALADFRRAEELGDPVAVAFDLGVLHYRMEDFAARGAISISTWRSIPGHAQTLEYRARLRRDTGDAAGAVRTTAPICAKAGRPNPGDYSAAALLLALMPDGGRGAALALLDEGMTRLGLIPQLQQQAIVIELQSRSHGSRTREAAHAGADTR